MKPAMQIGSNTRFLVHLVRTGQIRTVAATVRQKLWSETISFGLRRDLTVPYPAPDAAMPITIRQATTADVDRMMNLHESGVPPEELEERRDRRQECDHGMLPTSYVGVTDDGAPCFFQMLIYPEQNHVSKKLWDKAFPVVEPGQVMLEGVLVPSAFRGKKIMPMAMAKLSELARNATTTEAITFVDRHNIPSLKGCIRAGYVPYCHRIRRWRLFHESVSFVPVPLRTSIPGVTD